MNKPRRRHHGRVHYLACVQFSLFCLLAICLTLYTFSLSFSLFRICLFCMSHVPCLHCPYSISLSLSLSLSICTRQKRRGLREASHLDSLLTHRSAAAAAAVRLCQKYSPLFLSPYLPTSSPPSSLPFCSLSASRALAQTLFLSYSLKRARAISQPMPVSPVSPFCFFFSLSLIGCAFFCALSKAPVSPVASLAAQLKGTSTSTRCESKLGLSP